MITTERTALWKFLQGFCRIMCARLFDLKAYGMENVPKQGPAILASNHGSYLDPVVVGVPLVRPVSYFAKSELFSNHYGNLILRNLHAFPVRQGEGDLGAIREAIGRLKEGHMLNLYPEGSRSEDGRLQPVEPGLALVARRSGAPIIPVAINGSFHAWPRGQMVWQAHPVQVMYGPPLEIHGLKADAVARLLSGTWEKMLVELRAKHPESVPRHERRAS
ncbi:MAG TPA: lysophospholipid acyltransferase family protein [Tepidisphaeraceae bacterium]